jgi:hypothetical protein
VDVAIIVRSLFIIMVFCEYLGLYIFVFWEENSPIGNMRLPKRLKGFNLFFEHGNKINWEVSPPRQRHLRRILVITIVFLILIKLLYSLIQR